MSKLSKKTKKFMRGVKKKFCFTTQQRSYQSSIQMSSKIMIFRSIYCIRKRSLREVLELRNWQAWVQLRCLVGLLARCMIRALLGNYFLGLTVIGWISLCLKRHNLFHHVVVKLKKMKTKLQFLSSITLKVNSGLKV